MNDQAAGARIIFMGSPDFALPSLKSLAESFKVVGVITQPDRPAGRGKTLQPPPIKELANSLAIPVFQPGKLRGDKVMEQLNDWAPDVIVVAAYGQILRPEVLDLPPFGSINVHASLLPRWRGAAPIQAAIMHGDGESGITIMQMDEGLDTGPILGQQTIALDAAETAGSLNDKLSTLGAELLTETLPNYMQGKIEAIEQDDELATYAPLLKKADGELNFSLGVDFLARMIRAYDPWPGTFVELRSGTLKVLRASGKMDQKAEVGHFSVIDDRPAIGAQDGWLVLEEVQPAGKNAMLGSDYLRGARDWQGNVILMKTKERS